MEPRKVRVLLLFGGRSSEHSVSCVTAAGVMHAVDRSRYEIIPVGITRQGEWTLLDIDPQDVMVIIQFNTVDDWSFSDGCLMSEEARIHE